MRKIIAIVLAVVMIAAMSIPAFAAKTLDEKNPTANDVKVTYSTSESFVVTIPEKIELSVNAETGVGTSNDNIVSLDSLKISAGKKITVTVAGGADNLVAGHNYRLWDNTNKAAIGYTINLGDTTDATGTAVAQNGTLIEKESAKTFTQIVKYLDFVTEATTQAGDFEDTLTFTATVGAVTNA